MRRSIIVFLWAIILPALAIALLKFVERDPGIIILSGDFHLLGEITFATKVTTFILFGMIGFVVAYLAIRLIMRFITLPKSIGRYSKRRKERRADRYYARAELALYQNKPRQAEDLFLAAAEGGANRDLCYIGAAKAAEKLNSDFRRDQYLKQVEYSDDRRERLLGELKRGEFLNEIGEYTKAEKLLEPLLSGRRNDQAVALIAESYHQQGKLDKLYNLLPEIQRASKKINLSDERRIPLFLDIIEYAGRDDDTQTIRNAWKRVPKDLQENETMLLKYASTLIDSGDADSAETVLRRALRHQYRDSLMNAYGQLYRGNLPAQIGHARKFAAEHDDKAAAQLALGKLLLRSKNYQEAEQYAQKALTLDPTSADAYKLFGEAKVGQNDSHSALVAFQRANQILLPDTPTDVEETSGELLIDKTTKLNSGDVDADEAEYHNKEDRSSDEKKADA